MLICNLSQKKFNYEFEKLMRIFLPFEKIEVVNEPIYSDRLALLRETPDGDFTNLCASVTVGNKTEQCTEKIENDCPDFLKECERRLSVCLFYCMEKLTGYRPPWGILTGVRPARLFSRTAAQLGEKEANEYFSKKLLVSDKKISLCKKTMKCEEDIISLSSQDSFSIYIGIPFCPSRCSYCSFVSHSVESAGDLIPRYVDKLVCELRHTAKIVRGLNLRLETVYMGGGTPTTLSPEQLKLIFDTLKSEFSFEHLREFTVEAGRPDTVTREKLAEIKAAGATRISINPQTMQDSVLEAIGRRHTAKQTVDAFMLARQMGFSNINMDLIAGLTGDTLDGFKDTVNKVLALSPESVTVHTLSLKRASTMTANADFPDTAAGELAEKMVDYVRERLTKESLLPYYMYRQSKTVGNLENVGYAKKGFEGLYNVYIMDETHTIISCGASAVTKLREPLGDDIKRIFNFKYPYEYIDRFEILCERKKGIKDFYDNHPRKNQ